MFSNFVCIFLSKGFMIHVIQDSSDLKSASSIPIPQPSSTQGGERKS